MAKDEFNFDDFEYSGVKLPKITPQGDQSEPEPEPASLPAAGAAIPTPEPVAAIEPEDKKAKKKAKKVKPAKIKRPVVVAETERAPSSFLQKLSQASPYTVLLGLSVLALVIAVILLFVEFGQYGSVKPI